MRSIRIAALVFVCACGPAADNTDPDGGGGSNGGSDGTSSPTETKAGTFTIASSRYTVSNTPVEQGYATGTMYRIPPMMSGGGGGGCTNMTIGACDVQSCTAAAPTGDAGFAITYTDSGPVKISGVDVNDGTMTLTPGGYGYVTVSGAVALFNGGAMVRWLAPGNASGAPGFDVSLVAPTAAQVTAPAFVQGKVTASATQDLGIAWSGSNTVTAQVAGGSAGRSVVARCSFTGTSGAVPAAALSAVRSAGGSASIIVMMENRATRSPDGWNITFALQTYGLVPSGTSIGTLEIL
jgi:hypothetical protein